MDIPLFQIDAFADGPLKGNPAAVMPLPRWLPDDVLQAVASENNLSETAFYIAGPPPGQAVPDGSDAAYRLRWFTPAVEVALCGHATLATAAHLFDDVHPQARRLSFATLSGWLHVERAQVPGELVMDFPTEVPVAVAPGDPVGSMAVASASALGVTPVETLFATDIIHVLEDSAAVRAVVADLSRLGSLSARGVIVTAPAGPDDIVDDPSGSGDPVRADFVSRFFAAQAGAFEDPVTGSAHTKLAPFWGSRLGRARLIGRQLSRRGGTVGCEVDGDRVRLSGRYRRYLTGVATVPDGD
jgi:PhzF family phenazine biosynthesis protein